MEYLSTDGHSICTMCTYGNIFPLSRCGLCFSPFSSTSFLASFFIISLKLGLTDFAGLIMFSLSLSQLNIFLGTRFQITSLHRFNFYSDSFNETDLQNSAGLTLALTEGPVCGSPFRHISSFNFFSPII